MIDKIRAKQGLVVKPDPADAKNKIDVSPAVGPAVSSEQVSKKDARATRKEAVPKIKHTCGHESSLSSFTNRPCGPCREKANFERRQRKREKRKDKSPDDMDHFRLPDGAVYRKVYEAEAKLWTVALEIPGTPGFSAQGSGSFRTESVVDGFYRAWLRENGRTDAQQCTDQ